MNINSEHWYERTKRISLFNGAVHIRVPQPGPKSYKRTAQVQKMSLFPLLLRIFSFQEVWAGGHQMAIFLYTSPDLETIPSALHQGWFFRGTQSLVRSVRVQPSLLSSSSKHAQAEAALWARSFCDLLQGDKLVWVRAFSGASASYHKKSLNSKCS